MRLHDFYFLFKITPEYFLTFNFKEPSSHDDDALSFLGWIEKKIIMKQNVDDDGRQQKKL